MSFGAVFGALLGQLWLLVWPGHESASFAVIGAAALLTAAIEAPLTGITMTLELTHTLAITAPILLAAVGANLVARRLDLRSIYSARLTPRRAAPPEDGEDGSGPGRPAPPGT
jgi:H+/Cl- antiporter ClcA